MPPGTRDVLCLIRIIDRPRLASWQPGWGESHPGTACNSPDSAALKKAPRSVGHGTATSRFPGLFGCFSSRPKCIRRSMKEEKTRRGS